MRKEWIRSEEEKTSKRIQTERNRRRKHIQQKIEVRSFLIDFNFLFSCFI
jgi:hypothetical protein